MLGRVPDGTATSGLADVDAQGYVLAATDRDDGAAIVAQQNEP